MSRVKTVALAAGRDNIALPQIYYRRLRCCSAEVVKWLLVGWGRSTLWDQRCRYCARGVNGLAGPSTPRWQDGMMKWLVEPGFSLLKQTGKMDLLLLPKVF